VTLDAKLAARMVVKYPVLTIVGGLAIATAIAITVVAFEITHDFSSPTLPLPQSDRIVTLQLWRAKSATPETQLQYDLARWRTASSLADAGGFQTIERNLIVRPAGGGAGEGELTRVAEMSAAGFRVAGVPPLFGRALVDSDEAPGAAAAIVLGYSVWQTRFNADPSIVGRSVQLGSVMRTVVGVMPEGFAFPIAHTLWIPLPAASPSLERLQGPGLRAFGRLTPHATIDAAQTELRAISTSLAATGPADNSVLHARVLPYAAGFIQVDLLWQAYVLQSLLVMVLIICCANVATLVFARTATRQNEIIVRTALGASRARILAQFFVEALVLAVIGAGVGLTVANASIQWTMQLIWSTGFPKPFWWNDAISPITFVYAAVLTLLVSVLCGIVPALKGTRGGVHANLQAASGRGSSMKFGAGWTTVIVVQVALCVALLPTSLSQAWESTQSLAGGVGFASSEYLSVALEVETSEAPRRAVMYRDLASRVLQEPDVRGVAFADRFPGMDHGAGAVEVDGDASPDRLRPIARRAVVAPGFFEALDVPILAGRAFVDADVSAKRGVAIVNQLFVQNVLGGRNAIGRRVRFASSTPMPWTDIIGVVPDLGMNAMRPHEGAGIYFTASAGEAGVERMAVHVEGDVPGFAPRLRAIALGVNPGLQLKAPMPLDVVGRADQLGFRFFSFAMFAVAAIGVILSTTGIYAMMSFTVSRRTREIAIRAALGANPRRIVASIFWRAFLQVGLGAAAGVALILLSGLRVGSELWVPVGLGLFMLVVGVFACAAPARRALRIEPSDALKEI
jgi:putative ABC transport system permease protein